MIFCVEVLMMLILFFHLAGHSLRHFILETKNPCNFSSFILFIICFPLYSLFFSVLYVSNLDWSLFFFFFWPLSSNSQTFIEHRLYTRPYWDTGETQILKTQPWPWRTTNLVGRQTVPRWTWRQVCTEEEQWTCGSQSFCKKLPGIKRGHVDQVRKDRSVGHHTHEGGHWARRTLAGL